MSKAFTSGMGLDPGATFYTDHNGDGRMAITLDYDVLGTTYDDGPPVGNADVVAQCAVPGTPLTYTSATSGSTACPPVTIGVWNKAPITFPESKGVTGRVFNVRGGNISVAEPWHAGPNAERHGPASRVALSVRSFPSRRASRSAHPRLHRRERLRARHRHGRTPLSSSAGAAGRDGVRAMKYPPVRVQR